MLGPVDVGDVIYMKIRLRMPSTDLSSRRPPHCKKCTRTANCFIGHPPYTGSIFPVLLETHEDVWLKYWIAAESNQVIFRDECRFNFSSDVNRVRVWRPRGGRLNPAFALQRHTASTAGVMVWGAIAYNIRPPLVLTRGTMTAQRYVTRLYPHCYYPSLACPIPRFVSNRAYLGSFGTASWASHEFE
ncbi:transposable element Tcb1 transposase [Trichonephila clavipes]|nr:transposable element Tcb1 transposase [Trichonephila clavipes]